MRNKHTNEQATTKPNGLKQHNKTQHSETNSTTKYLYEDKKIESNKTCDARKQSMSVMQHRTQNEAQHNLTTEHFTAL